MAIGRLNEYEVDINGIKHTLQMTEEVKEERYPDAKKVVRKTRAQRDAERAKATEGAAANKAGTGASANK